MANSQASKMPKGCSSTARKTGTGHLLLLVILLATALTSCRDPWSKEQTHALKTGQVKENYIRVADSISYGVVVKNRDASDQWQEKWLSSFDRREFVDFIFEGVYSGELQPYDYFSDEPMKIEEVRQLEKNDDFERSHIGKIQFEERWYFDPQSHSMVKEVHSVMFAYEVYKDDGSFRGYSPAFKVKFQQNLEK